MKKKKKRLCVGVIFGWVLVMLLEIFYLDVSVRVLTVCYQPQNSIARFSFVFTPSTVFPLDSLPHKGSECLEMAHNKALFVLFDNA